MNRPLTILFALFASLLVSGAVAQRYEYIDINSGLSSNKVWSIAGDNNGFVWILNHHSIERYDGTNLEQYSTYENIDTDESYGTSRLEVFNNNVFIFDRRKATLHKYNSQLDRFEPLIRITATEHWGATSIHDIYQIADGTIYISTNVGLLRLTREGVSRVFTANEGVILSSYDSAESLIFYSRNSIYKLDTASDTAQEIASIGTLSQCRSLCYDPKYNRIWVGCKSELACYDVATKSVIELHQKFKIHYPVNALTSLGNGKIAVGYDGAGVMIVDAGSFDIEKEMNQGSNLSSNGVYDIMEDQQGRLWIATFSGGVTIYDHESNNFEGVVYENGDKLPNPAVTAILARDEQTMFFATNNGICEWNRKSNVWRQSLNRASDQSAMVTLSLSKDSRNNIYVGTFANGLYKIDQEGNSSNIPATGGVFALYVDRLDQIWSGGYHLPIHIRNSDLKLVDLLSLDNALSICRKNADEIFIGTSRGLYTCNIHSKRLNSVDLVGKEYHILSLSSYGDTLLAIATSGGGLLLYDYKEQKLSKFTRRNGLPSNVVLSTSFDNESNIWLAVETGVVKVDTRNSKLDLFTKENGLPTNGYIRNSILFSEDGLIYIGAYNGFTYFDPREIKHERPELKLYLKHLYIDNLRILPGDSDSPLTDNLDNTSQIELSARNNSLTLDYTTIGTFDSQKINYRWMLEGFNNSWVETKTIQSINYTNIPAGAYTLLIEAFETTTAEVIDRRQIEIDVEPMLHQTLVAKMVIMLIAIAIICSIFYFYMLIIRRRHSDEKIRFFANTAHNIRTPLSLINAPIIELKSEPDLTPRGRYYLDLATRNIAKLNGLIIDLLDFQKSDMKRSQLVLSNVDIVALLRERYESYSKLAEQKSTHFEFNCSLTSLHEWIDLAKIEKVIDNLLTNAFKYTLNGGTISLSLTKSLKSYRIMVSDNGIGIPKSQHKRLFREYYRGENAIASKVPGSGLGLILAYNYTRLHRGTISFKSEEGIGSEFIVTLNRGRDFYKGFARFVESENHEPIATKNLEIQSIQTTTKRLPRLILVEDNDDMRDYLRVSLSDDYAVSVAQDGEEALAMIQDIMPDCIISDVMMAGMDGLELTRRIRSDISTSHTPIILLTALANRDDLLHGLDVGADDYMVKPFDIEILKKKIEVILRDRRNVHKSFEMSNNTDDNLEFIDLATLKGREREFVERAIEVVEESMSDSDFSVDRFASTMCVSKSLLFKKLKYLTSQSPVNFIKVIRMRHAMNLLKSGDYSVADVATLVGFDDPKYFSTCFKSFTGKSPSKVI